MVTNAFYLKHYVSGDFLYGEWPLLFLQEPHEQSCFIFFNARLHLTNNDNHLSIMASLENELRKTERGIENILSAIENGVVTASTKNRLEELERRKEEVEQKIILEQTKTKLQLDRSDIVIFIQKALKQKPLLLIDLLVNKIVLYNDKIQIFYNYTDNKSPDDNHQDFLFYSNSDTIDNTWNRPNVRKRLNEYEIQAFI